MKKYFVILILGMTLALGTADVLAQDPPPPPPDHGYGSNRDSGGGAPIEGGHWILLGLGGAYLLYKVGEQSYKSYQEKKKSLLD
ncbi:MAG: hypothetical protein K9M51_03300 [Candidatus Gracilibacteria bacterium]|nr:hypothetical protein [Candidatus Gracilibacteria bacterium]